MSLTELLREHANDKASLQLLKKGVGLKAELMALMLHLFHSCNKTYFLLRRFVLHSNDEDYIEVEGLPDGQIFFERKTMDSPLKVESGEDEQVVELICGQDYRYQLSFH